MRYCGPRVYRCDLLLTRAALARAAAVCLYNYKNRVSPCLCF